MIKVKIFGGLGNQMFQYAFGRALSIRNQCEVCFIYDNSWGRNFGLNHFNVTGSFHDTHTKDLSFKLHKVYASLNRLTKYRLTPFNRQKYIYEYNSKFDSSLLEIKEDAFLEGYWQSESYFKEIERQIREEFKFSKAPDPSLHRIIEQIEANNSVSIHIRRGDYVSNPVVNKTHGLCSRQYYQAAMLLIKKRFSNPHFFFFSDDIDWVKREFGMSKDFTFIDFNKEPIDDFRLMSLCKNNIIANSTFSWWAAWLNNDANKVVITPQKWFKAFQKSYSDIIPENWIKIDG